MRTPSGPVLALLALASCRRRPATSPDAAAPEGPDAFAPGAPAPRTPRCRASADVAWVAQPPPGERPGAIDEDAGDEFFPAVASATVALAGDGTPWVAWADARRSLASVGRPSRGAALSESLGGGDHSDVALVLTGAARDAPAIAYAFETRAGRRHVVHALGARVTSCEQPESRDEALALAAAPSARGVFVAWDEGAPAPAGGAVMVQSVPLPAPAGRCPEARRASPADQDASDPSLAAAPDGGAALFWLAARELEPGSYNDTVTDVWGVALDAAGAPRGAPVRVTASAGHRFGLSAAVSPDGATVWLAYRVAPESGTEARGDGGQVALARLARNAGGLARGAEPVIVTGPGANPTGSPRVFALGSARAPAEVWWRERRDGAAVTVHRAVDATGRPAGDADDARAEPSLAGELPTWSDARGAAVAAPARTPGGGVGVARYRCDAAGR